MSKKKQNLMIPFYVYNHLFLYDKTKNKEKYFLLLDDSRRHDENTSFLPKQIGYIHDSFEYAFAIGKNIFLIINYFNLFYLAAFYKNCLLKLTTHRSDVEYALNSIYQEQCEDIDLTPFLQAICSHMATNETK